MHHPSHRSLAAAGLAILILAGCGEEEDREPSRTVAPEAEAPAAVARSPDRARPDPPKAAGNDGVRDAKPGRKPRAGRPHDTQQVKPAPDAVTRRLLSELTPEGGSPGKAPQAATDPASRKLWALVERATAGG